jgi:hypothetical protein
MTDGFAHLRDVHCNVAPRPLAGFPQGATRLTFFTRIGLTEPDAWLEVRKDGTVTDVACSEGLYAVIRAGEIVGVAGPAVPTEYGYSEIPA